MDIDLVAFSAELSALEEHLARCRDRIERLITPLSSSEREDILSPLYESERLLRSAERVIEGRAGNPLAVSPQRVASTR